MKDKIVGSSQVKDNDTVDETKLTQNMSVPDAHMKNTTKYIEQMAECMFVLFIKPALNSSDTYNLYLKSL